MLNTIMMPQKLYVFFVFFFFKETPKCCQILSLYETLAGPCGLDHVARSIVLGEPSPH